MHLLSQFKKTTIFLLCLFPTLLFAEIITSNQFEDVLEHVDKETLLVLDLNDTLMQTKEYYGSDTWAKIEIQNEMEKTGKTKMEVYEYFIPKWHEILLASSTLPMQKNTASIINQIQEKGVVTLGLTARYIEMAYPTHDQLKSIGIDLSKSGPYPYDIEVEGGYASKYVQGIAFVGLKNDKGLTLFRLLDSIGYSPKKVVFVDDKLKNVEAVQKAVEGKGIPFTGIHYKQ